MMELVNILESFDAWFFYSLHWAELAIWMLVAANAVRAIWEEYGC